MRIRECLHVYRSIVNQKSCSKSDVGVESEFLRNARRSRCEVSIKERDPSQSAFINSLTVTEVLTSRSEAGVIMLAMVFRLEIVIGM